MLCNQLSCIEAEFFREVKYSLGERIFLVGVLRRMCDMCECRAVDDNMVGGRSKCRWGDDDDDNAMIEGLRTASCKLRQLVLQSVWFGPVPPNEG